MKGTTFSPRHWDFLTVDGNASNGKVFLVNTNRVALVKVGKLKFFIPMRLIIFLLLACGGSLQAQRVPVCQLAKCAINFGKVLTNSDCSSFVAAKNRFAYDLCLT